MESIFNIAAYFLNKESMSHKKLQKLCYYAQAWHLANYGQSLVPNRFEAWIHGPVCPDLYSVYRSWGWENIPKNYKHIEFVNNSTACFLDKVYDVYGGYSGEELEAITHDELPWIKARNGLSSGTYSRNPISMRDMRNYYGERINRKYD